MKNRNIMIEMEINSRLVGTRIGVKTLSKELCMEEERVKQILKGKADLSYNEVILFCVYFKITPNQLFNFDKIDEEKTRENIFKEKQFISTQEDLIEYIDFRNKTPQEIQRLLLRIKEINPAVFK